ncbi:MAG TPA: DUF58 domain-containing protein [Thermoanaerobaculia bacterium]|jgi:uncharacterized protein (DUF58 family)|nr:DUF58 domain-containing protein [Thermoanaerobaculia bacterium]
MTATAAADPPAGEVRREIRDLRRRQALRWGLTAAAIALLLSLFSAGFFLYAAVVSLAALGLAALLPAASLLGVEVRRSLGRDSAEISETAETLELGESIESRLVLRNRKLLPALWLFWRDEVEPGLDVEGAACGFETLGSEGILRSACVLHTTRRGLFRIGPAVIEASDPFGLVRRFWVDPEVRFITVLPRIVPLGQGQPLGHRPVHEVPRRRSLFEDPSRFLGLRDYQPGDSLRRIHWRATARSGRLQVKLYEPAVLEGALLAVEMGKAAWPVTAGAGQGEAAESDPILELAVTAAASIADLVLGGGQAVALLSNGGDAAERYPSDWTGGSFRRLEDALEDLGTRRRISAFRPVELAPGRGRRQREQLGSALARLALAPGLSLPELLDSELPRLPRSLVVLVVTPNLGAGLGAVLSGLRRSGFEAGVVWIQRPGQDADATDLPPSVPIYPVRDDSDLENLGVAAL